MIVAIPPVSCFFKTKNWGFQVKFLGQNPRSAALLSLFIENLAIAQRDSHKYIILSPTPAALIET